MKKNIVLMILLLFSIALTACKNNDEKLVGAVKEIEVLNQKISGFYITYEEYKNEFENELKDIFSDEFKKEGNETILYYSKYNDALKSITDEVVKIVERQENETGERRNSFSGSKYDINIQISKVYTDENFNEKYIFVKNKIVYLSLIEEGWPEDEATIYTAKRYTLKSNNEENKWQISEVADSSVTEKDMEEKGLSFTTFYNKEVEYIININPFEDLN